MPGYFVALMYSQTGDLTNFSNRPKKNSASGVQFRYGQNRGSHNSHDASLLTNMVCLQLRYSSTDLCLQVSSTPQCAECVWQVYYSLECLCLSNIDFSACHCLTRDRGLARETHARVNKHFDSCCWRQREEKRFAGEKKTFHHILGGYIYRILWKKVQSSEA